MKRCSKCVLPETIPGITFNEAGVCEFCLSYKPKKYLGEEKLREIIRAAKEKKREYDCVVPLSGGRDSTYVLYMAIKKFELKSLGVHYDNEFRTPQAEINVQNACRKLGVDLVTHSSPNNVAHKIIKSRMLASLYRIGRGGRGGICWACGYGYRATVYQSAEKHYVPVILWGSGDNNYAAEIEKEIFRRLGEMPSKFFKLVRPNFYKAEYYQLQQRREFSYAGHNIFSRSISNNNPEIKEVQFFDYIPWERDKIKETITQELGWQRPPEHISTWKADCRLHALDNYYLIKLFNCTRDCFGYTDMINSGNMTREEAIVQEEAALKSHTEGIGELIKEIGLTEKQARKALQL